MAEPTSAAVTDVDYDQPIALRRKRRSSSVTNNPPTPIAPNKGRVGVAYVEPSIHNTTDAVSSVNTPLKPKRKKVRFSDPGQDNSSSTLGVASTSLTPAICRTSLGVTPHSGATRQSPRPGRRHSAPGTPYPSPYISGEIQFTPLSQKLDDRIKRRIRRHGLSEEMNKIEHEKLLLRKVEQRDSQVEKLKQEIEQLKSQKTSQDDQGERLVGLQQEIARLKEDLRAMTAAADMEIDWDHVVTHQSVSSKAIASESGDTIPLLDDEDEDEGMIFDNDAAASPSRVQQPRAASKDAVAQADLPDLSHDAELLGLALDLETAKQEKRELFSEFRSQFPSAVSYDAGFPNSHAASVKNSISSRLPSPPPNFLKQLSHNLKATQARAEDAELAFCALETELKSIGFPGDDADEILGEMKRQFRETRLELERLVPGETVSGFDNAKLLSSLSARIRVLVGQSRQREAEMKGVLQREGALKGQFDRSLERYERAERRIRHLEETIEIGAGDMLHSRQQLQALERDVEEKDKNIQSLITALEKYRNDIRGLEELITKMEADALARAGEAQAETYQRISDLECQVASEERGRKAAEESAVQRGQRIKELEEGLESATRQAMAVQVQLDALRTEKEEAIARLQGKLDFKEEQHDTQLGQLNSHVASLTTALTDANAEADKLQASKDRLEKRLKTEIEQAERTVESMQHDLIRTVAKFNESKKSLQRGSKVRQANSEIEEEESEGGSSAPLTPVSLVRFVDVEVGRGKNRRKYDSGIGLSNEDEEIEVYEDDTACVDRMS